MSRLIACSLLFSACCLAQPAGSPEEAFQKAARDGACKSFTTVLGPGSDPSHANHLHLDQRERGKGYRICQ